MYLLGEKFLNGNTLTSKQQCNPGAQYRHNVAKFHCQILLKTEICAHRLNQIKKYTIKLGTRQLHCFYCCIRRLVTLSIQLHLLLLIMEIGCE